MGAPGGTTSGGPLDCPSPQMFQIVVSHKIQLGKHPYVLFMTVP